jgi:hypothetical protein
MDNVRAASAGKPKDGQAGGLDHLLRLRGLEVRVKPADIRSQQLGVDRTHHLTRVDAHYREQVALFESFQANDHCSMGRPASGSMEEIHWYPICWTSRASEWISSGASTFILDYERV